MVQNHPHEAGKGQGGLKGISTSAVAVWINSHPICSHLSQTVKEMYISQDMPDNPEEEENSHVDGNQKRREEEN